MPIPDVAELKRRTQENLVTFLCIEVDLASTFCEIADKAQDPERRAKLLEDVRKAVSAIRHFQDRITDRSIREELTSKADTLDKILSSKLADIAI